MSATSSTVALSNPILASTTPSTDVDAVVAGLPWRDGMRIGTGVNAVKGTLGGIATEPPGEITVALRCCPGFGAFTPFDDNKGVWIQTFDSSVKPRDTSFHLIVLTH